MTPKYAIKYCHSFVPLFFSRAISKKISHHRSFYMRKSLCHSALFIHFLVIFPWHCTIAPRFHENLSFHERLVWSLKATCITYFNQIFFLSFALEMFKYDFYFFNQTVRPTSIAFWFAYFAFKIKIYTSWKTIIKNSSQQQKMGTAKPPF